MRKIQQNARRVLLELRGTRCARIFRWRAFFAIRWRGEGFVLRGRFVAKCAGKQPRDGIDNHRRRQFAAAQNIVSDGYFVVGKMLGHAFVHAFITAANQ